MQTAPSFIGFSCWEVPSALGFVSFVHSSVALGCSRICYTIRRDKRALHTVEFRHLAFAISVTLPLYHLYLFSWRVPCVCKPICLWIWIHFLVDKMCICKKLMLAAGVLQDQLLMLSFLTVACTWQITLKSCFHNLLCLVVLPTAVIFVAALGRKKLLVLPRMTDKQLFCKCL